MTVGDCCHYVRQEEKDTCPVCHVQKLADQAAALAQNKSKGLKMPITIEMHEAGWDRTEEVLDRVLERTRNDIKKLDAALLEKRAEYSGLLDARGMISAYRPRKEVEAAIDQLETAVEAGRRVDTTMEDAARCG